MCGILKKKSDTMEQALDTEFKLFWLDISLLTCLSGKHTFKTPFKY